MEFKREANHGKNNNQNLSENNSTPQEIDFSKITIPVQLFFKLKKIIEEGNITQLKKELEDLCLLNEGGKILNKKLVPLAEKNDLEEILNVLERVKIMGKGHD